MTTRVLIADDQELVRTGFRMILGAEDDVEVVGEASDGLDAVAQATTSSPDVVLMDVQMPRMDGIEATRQVVQRMPGCRVLILTTFDDDDYLYVEDDYAIAVSPHPLTHSFIQPCLQPQNPRPETGSFPALGKLHVAPNRLSNNKTRETP